MELLGEFFEKDSSSAPNGENGLVYKVRKAARAVVFSRGREIALIFVSKNGYHKLPGGGVERGEDLRMALQREIKEEIGGEVEIGESVGAIIEYRDFSQLMQISYCYLANLSGELVPAALTVEEQARGFKLMWVRLEDAIDIMRSDAPADDVGHFIKQRDLLFLEKARELILKKQAQ